MTRRNDCILSETLFQITCSLSGYKLVNSLRNRRACMRRALKFEDEREERIFGRCLALCYVCVNLQRHGVNSNIDRLIF